MYFYHSGFDSGISFILAAFFFSSLFLFNDLYLALAALFFIAVYHPHHPEFRKKEFLA